MTENQEVANLQIRNNTNIKLKGVPDLDHDQDHETSIKTVVRDEGNVQFKIQ